MKRKMTILLFGLLLAVGWTSNAFAQSYTLKASEMKTDGEYWTYEWVDANGVTQTSTYINPTTLVADSVTDPYQIYGLLRAVYMDKRLPGPFYSAYMKDGVTREREVYYGGMAGGWEIPYSVSTDPTQLQPIGNITITFGSGYVEFRSITVTGNNGSTSWTLSGTTANLPSTWSVTSGTLNVETDGSACYFTSQSGTGGSITIPGSDLNGSTSATITVETIRYAGGTQASQFYVTVSGDFVVSGNAQQTAPESTTQFGSLTWTVNGNAGGNTLTGDYIYKPENEGYTALVVSLYNDTTKIYPEASAYWGSFEFTTKAELINYITNNISHVKLLTDGVRIGEGQGVGTVFNASGTYNRFFFLGKGQARMKSDYLKNRIANNYWPSYCGEEGPFKFMFEEFSPTTGATYSDITDFYLEMMDGKVYNVIHDCASVIQNKHQFSMAGKKGTEYKALSGLNFFIPDYRLLWWDGKGTDPSYPNQSMDGRDMNPYQSVNNDGTHGSNYRTPGSSNYYYFGAYYAQYNQQHPPLVGIYMIHLDAEASPTNVEHQYQVDLDWTSSLNEMSGSTVPQNYVVYIVKTDENGVETLDTLVVTGQTHYDYTVPQNEHSYTITYIVQGSPSDNEHPEFIAWSNQDQVVIPGWNDFLNLALEHYESDFDVPKMRNWYRNFLAVNNEDELNALSTDRITGGENLYTLLRYDYNNPEPKTEVATLSFEVTNGGKTVDYTAALKNQDVEENQYLWSELGFNMTSETMTAGTTKGTLSVKGNGDIIIQPSGYDVNFYSITVTSGNTTVTSWNANQTLASRGWTVTNGSEFIKDSGTNYYYLEGGGYIRIPYTVLGNYTNVKVVINASRDASKTAWISVNESEQDMTTAAATNYTWNSVNTTASSKAPTRATTTYEKVTDFSQLVEGKKYILVYSNYAMGNLNTSSYSGAVVSVTANNDGTVTAGDDVVAFTLGGSYSSYSAYNTYTFAFPNGSLLGANRTGNSWSGYTYMLTTGSYTNWTLGTNNGGYRLISDQYSGYSVRYRTSGFALRATSDTNSEQALLYVEKETTPEPPTPGTEGLVRLGNLPLVDQFYAKIPKTNNHPNRYGYVLKYVGPDTIIYSTVAEVPVQHTGAEVQGYYTIDEMLGDTIPAKFLTEDMLSAEIDMNLSPTSAPYFYTINSKKNGVPANAWSNYVDVLQRRGDGTYQEMLTKGGGVENPYFGKIYPSGPFDQVDYRHIQAAAKSDSLSYVPVVWTMGVDRRYFADDSTHNSYGAPIWEVRVGDIEVAGSHVERQAKNALGEWNDAVNWYDENGDACSVFIVDQLQATGILPVCDVDYEPYMFRVWVVGDGLRGYKWVEAGQDPNLPGRHVVNDTTSKYRTSPQLIYTKMCSGPNDLTLNITKDASNNYANCVMFGGLNTIKPTFLIRFYYKVKGTSGNLLRGTREGEAEDHVGYVVKAPSDPGDPGTGVRELVITGEVVSKTYYNVQGMMSDQPFDGVNIVVTRYSDGTTVTSKVIR